MDFLKYIIDIIVLAIIVLSAFMSARRGFVRTIIEIVGFIAIIVIVNSVSTPIAEKIYTYGIEPKIVESVNESVEDASDKAKEKIGETKSSVSLNPVIKSKSGEDIWKSLPKILKDNSISFGISHDDFVSTYENNIKDGTQNAVIEVSGKIIKPIVVRALSLGVSAVLFIILGFIVRLSARLINKLFSKSVAGKINSTLGSVLGIIKGVFFSFVFCIIVLFAVSLTPKGIWIFTPETVRKSFAVKTFIKFLPQVGFFSFLSKF